MDSSQAVTPPYLATPFRLEPFRALTLAPHRVGDAVAGRALSRPYREVAGRLRRWESAGRVVRDAEAAVYLHEYTSHGITVRGLVGALDTSRRAPDLASRAVLPHERIYPHRARDLADRMLSMRLNPAPILLVHRGPADVRAVVHALLGTAPLRRFTDRGGQAHRIWPLRGEQLSRVRAALQGARPVIADGHHRYAAYLQLQQAHPGTAWDRGLAMLVDQDDTPLFLGAIHRVLRRVRLPALAEALSASPHTFHEASRDLALAALGPRDLAVTDGRRWAGVHLVLDNDHSAVEALHQQVLPSLDGLLQPIGYVHSAEEALATIRRERDVAILMPAPDFDLVHRIVAHDRLLPEKATSFQPKPSTGVLMRSLDDG